jgi:hypothetical protein
MPFSTSYFLRDLDCTFFLMPTAVIAIRARNRRARSTHLSIGTCFATGSSFPAV